MHIQNLVKFYQFLFKILSGNEILNEILTSVKGHDSIINVRKMMCNNINPNLDLVCINAYTKFVLKILSGNKIMTDGMPDRWNNRQPISSIAPLFQNGAVISRICQVKISDINAYIYKIWSNSIHSLTNYCSLEIVFYFHFYLTQVNRMSRSRRMLVIRGKH